MRNEKLVIDGLGVLVTTGCMHIAELRLEDLKEI